MPVCVCAIYISKYNEWILVKMFCRDGGGPRTGRSDFGGDPDRNTYSISKFPDPDHSSDPEIL